MPTAAARLLELSSLSSGTAYQHWRAMRNATGATSGEMLVARSRLRPTATAAAHLLDAGFSLNDVIPYAGYTVTPKKKERTRRDRDDDVLLFMLH